MRSLVFALLALLLAVAVGLQVPVAPAQVSNPALAKPAVSLPFDAGAARPTHALSARSQLSAPPRAALDNVGILNDDTLTPARGCKGCFG